MTKLKWVLLSSAGILVGAAALSMLPMAAAFAQGPSGVAGGPANAAIAAETPQVSGNAIFIDKQASAAARTSATSALMAKASAQRTIRVIAGLNVSMRAPHELSDTESAGQEQVLRAAQSSVVGRVLGAAATTASVIRFDYIPFVAMNVTAAQLGRLVADPDVVNIQEDVPVPPTLTQSVPFIHADDVWTAGFPGTGITVAILDTGVDTTHDMFPGSKIASEACYSTTSASSSSVCPGGVASSTAAGSGVNCPYPTISGCLHGTHVAGIAAGNMASPVLRGVAKDSSIIAIQVFSRFDSAASCGSNPVPCVKSFTSDQILGLQRVYALRGAFVISSVNMSLGSGQFFAPCDTTEAARKAAIDLLRGVKIATVIASGNDGFNGSMGTPGCISSAIAVGSTLDTANTLSSFSNHAANVRLLAPGSNIVSSVPPGPKTTASLQGTSMATPHVTGAFALLRDVKGGSTVDDIAAALECTGVDVTRAGITEPRIDVNAARLYLLHPPSVTKNFTFNTAAQAAQWTAFAGTWGVNTAAPGTLRVTSITAGWKLATTPNCNESETITSRLKRVWPTGQTSNFGIVFKTQLSATNKTMHGYMAAINRDVSGFNQKNVVLWRFDGVNMQTGAGNATNLCAVELNTIATNVYYTLKVVSRGGLHKFYVNNVLKCTATDYTYGTGRAGLITFFDATTPAGNAFQADTFVIDPTETVPTSSPATGEVALGQ